MANTAFKSSQAWFDNNKTGVYNNYSNYQTLLMIKGHNKEAETITANRK